MSRDKILETSIGRYFGGCQGGLRWNLDRITHRLTVVHAVDGTAHGEFIQHGHHAGSARRTPVVGETQVVVRPEVEHALRAVRQPDFSVCIARRRQREKQYPLKIGAAVG